MNKDHDVSQTVGFEVDGGPDSMLEAPEIGTARRSVSKWPITLIAVLLAGLAALFLLSRGSDSETVEPSLDASVEDFVGIDQTQNAGVLSLPMTDPIVPVEASSPLRVGRLIESDDGFIALSDGSLESGERTATSQAPELLRSADGLVWEQIETTLRPPDGRELGDVRWTQPSVTSDGFGLIGIVDGDPLRTEFASSPQGQSWTVLAEPGLPDPFDQELTIVAAHDDTIVATLVRQDALACEDDVTARPTPASELIEIDQANRTVRTLAGGNTWSLLGAPAPLSGGGFAFIDLGVVEEGVCRPPGIVVLNAENDTEEVFEIPFSLDNDRFFPARILGESGVVTEEGPNLLVSTVGQLWSLNIAQASWELLSEPADSHGVEFGSLTLATGRTRVYQPTSEGLLLIELQVAGDGGLRTSPRVAPLDAPDDFSILGFTQSTILHAGDEQVLLSDVFARLWTIDVLPPSPNAN